MFQEAIGLLIPAKSWTGNLSWQKWQWWIKYNNIFKIFTLDLHLVMLVIVWWWKRWETQTKTFLVFFQEKCRAIKFNLVVETLYLVFVFLIFFVRDRQITSIWSNNHKNSRAGTFSGSIWRNLKILIREVSSNVCHSGFTSFYGNLLKDNWQGNRI